jgi:hypothetical protein
MAATLSEPHKRRGTRAVKRGARDPLYSFNSLLKREFLLVLSRTLTPLFSVQVVYHVLKLTDVLEVPVDRRETYVRHSVQRGQMLHDRFTDLGTGDLKAGGPGQVLFDGVHHGFDVPFGDRPLSTSERNTSKKFGPFEILSAPVALDDTQGSLFHMFVRGEAGSAHRALSSPPDRTSTPAVARIDDTVLRGVTPWAAHQARWRMSADLLQ